MSDGPLTIDRASTSLHQEPAFMRWAVAEGVSWVGSAITTVVLPVLVFEATGSAAQTGIVFALRVVPYLVFGLVAGPLADRGNRRLLIVGGNVIEGVLVASIPVAHALGVLGVAQVYAVGLLSATAFVFSDAAVFGAVPALVGPERVPAANGMLASISATTEILGPLVAGALVALVGPATAVSVDAVSFFVAAAVQTSLRSDFRDPAGGGTAAGGARAAWRFIREHTAVLTLVGVGFGNSLAFGAVFGLLVPYAADRLGFATGDARIGVLYGAIGVGNLVAGLVFARLFRTRRIPVLTPATLLCSGVLAIALAATTGWVLAAVLIGTFALASTTTITAGITYRQLVAPDHLRSSVNVIGRMVSWGGQPFGAALGALAASATTVPAAYAGAGVVMAVTAVVARLLLRSAIR
ncbi:MAG: MFS transporter [Ilumatobacteraceae bacterium]